VAAGGAAVKLRANTPRSQLLVDHASELEAAIRGGDETVEESIAVGYLAGFDDGLEFARLHPTAAAELAAEWDRDQAAAGKPYREGQRQYLAEVAAAGAGPIQ
jgi:class 3 adenylate cyclase